MNMGVFNTIGVIGLATGLDASCYLPVDVYFLQDTTGSFIEDLPNVKAQIPSIIEAINTNNPGSYFGIGEFRDKPYLRLGELSDFCTKLTHPLSSDINSVQTAFGALFASGGGDLPEVMLGSIIDSVNDPAIGWRSLARNVKDDLSVSGARLIIMSTDAKPHDPLDYELYPETCPAYMIPYPDDVTGISANTLCRRYDYPSVEQMRDQIRSHDTYLAILTPDDDAEVTAKWRYINDDVLGNPSNFYQFIKNDSSDILSAIVTVLNGVTEYVCALTTQPPATTAAVVTTTPAATTPAPTIATTAVTPAPTTEITTPTPITTPAQTISPAPTTATPAPVVTTVAPTTATPAPVVTTVAPTLTPELTTLAPPATCPEVTCPDQCHGCCTNPCFNHCNCCRQKYGMIIDVNDRPKKLVVDYGK